MTDSVFSRLCDAVDDLQRLVRSIHPLEIQLAVEHIVDRLDGIIDQTVGLPDAQPPDQRDVLYHGAGEPDICPVCRQADCTHWRFLNAEEHR